MSYIATSRFLLHKIFSICLPLLQVSFYSYEILINTHTNNNLRGTITLMLTAHVFEQTVTRLTDIVIF